LKILVAIRESSFFEGIENLVALDLEDLVEECEELLQVLLGVDELPDSFMPGKVGDDQERILSVFLLGEVLE